MRPISIEKLNPIPAMQVKGTLQVEGASIIFMPETSFPQNADIQMVISKEIHSLDGRGPVDDLELIFRTTLSPFYTTVTKVLRDISTFVSDVAEDEIEEIILDVSRFADAIAYEPYGTTDDAGNSNAYIFEGFTRFETDCRLLQKGILKKINDSEASVRLGDLTVDSTFRLQSEAALMYKVFAARRDEFEKLLKRKGHAAPAAVTRGGATSYPIESRLSF